MQGTVLDIPGLVDTVHSQSFLLLWREERQYGVPSGGEFVDLSHDIYDVLQGY